MSIHSSVGDEAHRVIVFLKREEMTESVGTARLCVSPTSNVAGLQWPARLFLPETGSGTVLCGMRRVAARHVALADP